jgi:hypothetical protein
MWTEGRDGEEQKWGCSPPTVLGCHFLAALRAATAGFNTAFHIADAFAVSRTLPADFSAFAAGMLVMHGTNEHEVC